MSGRQVKKYRRLINTLSKNVTIQQAKEYVFNKYNKPKIVYELIDLLEQWSKTYSVEPDSR